ncbi:putative Tetratricopeptide repeat protein [Gammaproteobacteria bacterium]
MKRYPGILVVALGLGLEGCSMLDVFDGRREPAPVVDGGASKPAAPRVVTRPKSSDVQVFAYGKTLEPREGDGSNRRSTSDHRSDDAVSHHPPVPQGWQSIPDEPVKSGSRVAPTITPSVAANAAAGGSEPRQTEARDTQVAMREYGGAALSGGTSLPKSRPVAQLMAEAERLHQGGNSAAAAAALERALRIEPHNAEIYNRLARIRFDQGQYAQAAELASRSTSLAGVSSPLARDNWRIGSAARAKLGQTAPPGK